MNQQTPVGVTYLVISILGTLAMLIIGSMCYCAVVGVDIQESLMTAMISLSGSLTGAVGAILVSTKHNSPSDPVRTEITNTTSTSTNPIIARSSKKV